jgi:hypothetical protein
MARGPREQPDLPDDLETDPRFPSGPWRGYYEQRGLGGGVGRGRGRMELGLMFRKGRITGSGRDPVGVFTMDGTYDLQSGLCSILKQYATHKVDYRGYNEGKGIWGQWRINAVFGLIGSHGPFHIWPVGEGAEAQAEEAEEEVPAGPATVGG